MDSDSVVYSPELKRFDLALFKIMSNDQESNGLEDLEKEFPEILTMYVEQLLRFGPMKSMETRNQFGGFLKHKDVIGLFAEVEKKFPNTDLVIEKKAIVEALRRYKVHFPNKDLPSLHSFVSGFQYQVVVSDSMLGIGLDMYLGAEFKEYALVGIPQYKFKTFEREYLVSDVVKAWLLTEFDERPGSSLLDQMVAKGKIIYLLEAILPESEFHYLLNFDLEDLAWCEKNQSDVWFHLVDMELLYNTELEQVRKFMGDAPFIPGFPEGSPGRVGHWLGHQIVKAYMDKHPKITLKELMANENANQLLIESSYKPKR